MILPTAPILFYNGDLSKIYDTTSAGSSYAYVDGAIDVLSRFERIIIGSPQTDDEIDRTIQILSALRRISPEIKVYGFTSKRDNEAITVWATQEQAWQDTFGNLIDGIYIENFDAIDIGPDGVSNGAWTRADQLLAVIGCHNDGYAVWAESEYPELVLGPASTTETGDNTYLSNLGEDPNIQDVIGVMAYTSELESEAKRDSERAGIALYLRDYAAQDGINLYTAVFHHSPQDAPAPNESPETYVPLDTWKKISDEVTYYGLGGFGVFTSLLGDPGERRWFLTNSNRSYSFVPTSNDANLSYCRLYGKVFPTIYGESISPLLLRYERADTLIAGNPYFTLKGEEEITPDFEGNWELLIAAAPDPGTAYRLELSLDEFTYRPIVKSSVMLIGGESHAF